MNEDKKVLAKEALQALSEIEDSLKMEQIIKDNKISFEVEGVKYHIRKPNLVEVTEIEEAKRKKYLEFIKDDSYMFRKSWIESYKKKGIDIAEMESKGKLVKSEMEAAMLRLATATEPKAITELKNEILKLKDEQFGISMQITDLLSYSIEDQINIFSLSYTAFKVLEKEVNKEWVRAFSSYEEFRKDESKVAQTSLFYISYIVYGD